LCTPTQSARFSDPPLWGGPWTEPGTSDPDRRSQEVKGYIGAPDNERADVLTGRAAEKKAWSPLPSSDYGFLRGSGRAKTPGMMTLPTTARRRSPLPPQKELHGLRKKRCVEFSCQDPHQPLALGGLPEEDSQARGHCWFCGEQRAMTRSPPSYTVTTHDWPKPEVWHGRGLRVLLMSPRWES